MGASHAAIGIMFRIPFEKIRNINPMASQRYDRYSDLIFEFPHKSIYSSSGIIPRFKTLN